MMLGGANCAGKTDGAASNLKWDYVAAMSLIFGADFSSINEDIVCEIENELPHQDAFSHKSHFYMDWENEGKCQLVTW